MADLYPPPQPPAGGPQAPTRPKKPHRGTTVLVFGILGLVCCVIFGILAWLFGNQDLQEMDRGIMDPEGRGLTSAGRICGMVSVGLGILGIIYFIVMMALGVGLSGLGGFRP